MDIKQDKNKINNMKHLKIFEDYTNDEGNTVYTTSGPDYKKSKFITIYV